MSTPVSFQLAEADVTAVKQLLTKGRAAVRTQNRARVLLLAHKGLRPEAVAAAALVSRATVYNVWTRYRAGGREAALHERPRPGQPRKITPRVEAASTTLACSAAPAGAPTAPTPSRNSVSSSTWSIAAPNPPIPGPTGRWNG